MVGFRKLFPALALAALSVGVASASIECAVSAPQKPVRAEGLTEKVGDITLTCTVTAGSAAANLTGTFQIKTDGPAFTTRLNDDGDSTVELRTSLMDPDPEVDASLLGEVVNATTLRFTGVKLDYDDADLVAHQFTITISNMRINATQAASDLSPVMVTVNGLSFGDEDAGLTIKSGTSPVAVAAVAPGLKISQPAQADAGDPRNLGSALHVQQCTTEALPDEDTPLADVATKVAYVTFTPTFKGAFKGFSTTAADILANKLLEGEFPESADNNHGTFLVAQFKNIPANAKLYVGNRNLDAAGAISAAVLAVKDLKVKTVPTTPAFAWKEVTVASDGTATAVWQVVNIENTGLSAYSFPVRVVYADTNVGLKAVQATGSFSPISDKGAADVDSDIPRFVASGLSYKTLITVDACSTTLLFPYVTAGGGWDTGIAISNTSADFKLASGTYYMSGSDKDPQKGQSGTCTLYYSGTGAPSAPITTTINVDAGKTLAFTTSGGNADYGVTATPEFSGYVVAQCNFQLGHGFAFLSGPGAAGPAGVGYNALVLTRKDAGAEALGN